MFTFCLYCGFQHVFKQKCAKPDAWLGLESGSVHMLLKSTLTSLAHSFRPLLHIGCKTTEEVKFTVIHNYGEPWLPCQSNKINTFLTEFNNMVL